jgi:hypothetical protein
MIIPAPKQTQVRNYIEQDVYKFDISLFVNNRSACYM